jgi:hypothetical protein
MTLLIENLELDDDALVALKAFCKETRMKPSKAIQAAIVAYRRMKANESYLGTGELDLADEVSNETTGKVKKAVREKYGYSD